MKTLKWRQLISLIEKRFCLNTFIRGNRDLIKDMNRSLLLNIIRQQRQVSRKQLTDISGLSVGSVSGIVNDLLANDWIQEIGEGDYTGGRRQTIIKLNPTAGYAIGVKLMEQRVVVAITNFESEILGYQEANYTSTEPTALVAELQMIIENVLLKAGIDRTRLLGLGVGVAGVVHSADGIVHYSPYFDWRDVPLASLLSERTALPVYIENDVNTLTLTEQLFGAGRHHSSFVVMTIGRGIGMGLVINNQLYRGTGGGAGEIGHTVLSGLLDHNGTAQFSTLEDLSSDPAVITEVRSIHPQVEDLPEVIHLADSGDAHAQRALSHSGQLLGAGLANIVNILNPQMVIISGEGLIAGDYRLQPLLETLKKYTFNGLMDDLEIVVEPTDDRAWARGAASLVISKLFESPMADANLAS
jgi:N-acetylglucosamine repressor